MYLDVFFRLAWKKTWYGGKIALKSVHEKQCFCLYLALNGWFSVVNWQMQVCIVWDVSCHALSWKDGGLRWKLRVTQWWFFPLTLKCVVSFQRTSVEVSEINLPTSNVLLRPCRYQQLCMTINYIILTHHSKFECHIHVFQVDNSEKRSVCFDKWNEKLMHENIQIEWYSNET